jgi:cytochrome c-type protein NapC
MAAERDPTDAAAAAGEQPRRFGWPRKPATCSGLTLIALGTVVGVILWGGFNTVLEYTNRSDFCLSCHEMRTAFDEYEKSPHYTNRTGTTVTCADCHVATSKTPNDYARKLLRKATAANDVWGHLRGTIDTPEKYEAKRLEMAQREWARMKASDSRECRNCHNMNTMDQVKQKKRSIRKHEEAIEENKTCIDCHKGIAHKPVHHLIEEEPAKSARAD